MIIISVKSILLLQHVFVNGKSRITQMLAVYENACKCLDEGEHMDLILLDFSNAFDSVSGE